MFLVRENDPFNIRGRIATTILAALITLLTTALLPLVAPSSFKSESVLSIEGFASSALSVTISLFFSILFAAPLIRKAFATDDPLAERMALILAAAFSLLILILVGGIILLTALVESLPF